MQDNQPRKDLDTFHSNKSRGINSVSQGLVSEDQFTRECNTLTNIESNAVSMSTSGAEMRLCIGLSLG